MCTQSKLADSSPTQFGDKPRIQFVMWLLQAGPTPFDSTHTIPSQLDHLIALSERSLYWNCIKQLAVCVQLELQWQLISQCEAHRKSWLALTGLMIWTENAISIGLKVWAYPYATPTVHLPTLSPSVSLSFTFLVSVSVSFSFSFSSFSLPPSEVY